MRSCWLVRLLFYGRLEPLLPYAHPKGGGTEEAPAKTTVNKHHVQRKRSHCYLYVGVLVSENIIMLEDELCWYECLAWTWKYKWFI